MSPRHLGDIPDREGTVLVIIGGHLCLGWEGIREPLLRAAPPRGGPAAPCPACRPPYLLLVPGWVLHVHQHLSLPSASGLHGELCPLLHHVACGLDACPGMGGSHRLAVRADAPPPQPHQAVRNGVSQFGVHPSTQNPAFSPSCAPAVGQAWACFLERWLEFASGWCGGGNTEPVASFDQP